MESGNVVNISFNGKPFYVYPEIYNENDIRQIMNRIPERGLYFLFQKGRIVYIGASRRNVYERLLDHKKSKEFDSYFILTAIDDNGKINENTLERCIRNEAKLIKHFNPEYNSISTIALSPVRNIN